MKFTFFFMLWASVFALVCAGVCPPVAASLWVSGKVAYTTNARGNLDIAVMGPDGAHIRFVTSDVADEFDPTWSPDGRQILYTKRVGSEHHIWLSDDYDGYSHHFIVSGQHPSWGSDGERFVARDQQGGLTIYELSIYLPPEGLFVLETIETIVDIGNPAYPAWSPDGRFIAYVGGGEDLERPWVGGSLYIYDFEADRSTKVVSGSPGRSMSYPTWGRVDGPNRFQILFAWEVEEAEPPQRPVISPTSDIELTEPDPVLIYVGDVWWITPEAAAEEARLTKSLLNEAGILAEITEDGDRVSEWMRQTAADGEVNVFMLYGVLPNAIYPAGNTQADGSVAENWIESRDGNTILNQADYLGWWSDGDSYVRSEGGFTQALGEINNRWDALRNLMDNPNISFPLDSNQGVGGTPMIVTGEGRELTPSLVNFSSDRPFPLWMLDGEWFAEKILARTDVYVARLERSVVLADPVIVRDGDRGRIAIVHQTFFEDDPKGEVAAELIINYLIGEPTEPVEVEALRPTVTAPVENEREEWGHAIFLVEGYGGPQEIFVRPAIGWSGYRIYHPTVAPYGGEVIVTRVNPDTGARDLYKTGPWQRLGNTGTFNDDADWWHPSSYSVEPGASQLTTTWGALKKQVK